MITLGCGVLSASNQEDGGRGEQIPKIKKKKNLFVLVMLLYSKSPQNVMA